MANISKIKIDGTTYNVKDETARGETAKISGIVGDLNNLKTKKHYTISYNETDEALSITGDK